MGILTDLTPASFDFKGTTLNARILTIKELVVIVKKSLIDNGEKARGAELDKLVTDVVDKFNYPLESIEAIIYESVRRDTKGFDKDDAAQVAQVTNRRVAYQIFKYAIYGAFDEPKKAKPRKKGPSRMKAKKKKAKRSASKN